MSLKSELALKRREEAKKKRIARVLNFIERHANRRKIPIPKLGCFLRQGMDVLVASYKKVGPGAICLPVACSGCRNYNSVVSMVIKTGRVTAKEMDACTCGAMVGEAPRAHCFAVPDNSILPKEGVPFMMRFGSTLPIAEEATPFDRAVERVRRIVATPRVAPGDPLDVLKRMQQELFTLNVEVKPLNGPKQAR